MAFPETPLPVAVEISLDGTTWTDVTGDVRASDQIQITRGRSDWGQQVDAGQCRLTLDNRSGNYSPRNPEGDYYGKIGRNTPIRVSVNTGDVALDLPGDTGDYASTPDASALDITGDIDIRVDATLPNWIQPDYPSAGSTSFPRTVLVGKHAEGEISWAFYTSGGKLLFEYSADGSATTWIRADSDLPLNTTGRLAVRFTMDVDSANNQYTAKFWWAETIDGPWTESDSGTLTGTPSIFSGTAPLRIGDAAADNDEWHPALGRVHAVELRSGVDGTVVANPDFTAQTVGTTSFTDSAGCTWTLGGNAEITNRKTRFVGEVSSWNTRWDTGGFDVTTEVEASGILRRLGQGAVPVKSPMYREFTSSGRREQGIVAYWPMEDGSAATQFASAYDGHPPFTFSETVAPAAYSDFTASAPLPTITTGSGSVVVPPYDLDIQAKTTLGFFCAVPSAGVVSEQRLISWSMDGAAVRWSLIVDTAGLLSVHAWDMDDIELLDSGTLLTSINGKQKYIIVQISATVPDVFWDLTVVDIVDSLPTSVPDGSSTVEATNGSFTGSFASRITGIRFGEEGLMNGTALGHITVGNNTNAYVATAGALAGWNAEEATSRISRIGFEEGLHAYATSGGDEQCGVQPAGTILDIMQAADQVDEGILAELRTVLGIRYITRASMYNQFPTLTLDYTADDGLVAPLEPVEDDQSVNNDVTVQRTDGASAHLVQDTGPLSTLPPPTGIGVYDASYTLNLLNDDQPLQHAGWRLHMSTWDEIRYPVITVDLASAPDTIPDAIAVDTGSVLRVTNPPTWLPPGPIDVLVQGYTETMDQYTWTIAYNCTPAGPWDVAWVNGGTTATEAKEFIWADTEGSQLVDDLTSTQTEVNVFTTVEPVWTPNVRDTPLDWEVGGEVMTVIAPGTLLNTNSFFDSDVTGWSGASATVAHSTAVVSPDPRAVGSMLVTPAGGASAVSARSDLTAVDSIVPGQQYVISGWFYSPDGWSALYPSAQWCDASGSVMSSGGDTQSVPAGQWTYLEDTVTAPSSTSRVRIVARADNTPSASDIYYVWALRITRTSSSAVYDTFARTASSGWGSADSGQTWTVVSGTASHYSVGSGKGSISLTSASSVHLCDTTSPGPDTDMYVDIYVSQVATGAAIYASLVSREADDSNHYMARVAFNTDSTFVLSCRKRVGGTETELDTFTAQGTYAADTAYRLRFQTVGNTVQAKVWLTTDPEPVEWQCTSTDTSFTDAENIGVRALRATGNTNSSPSVRYANFQIVNPQTYTVVRSQNQIVKNQSSGTSVELARPSYVAL